MAKVRTPIKAIRAKCIDCSGGVPKEVRECPIEDCPLYPYRMGRRPRDNQTHDASEAQKPLDS